MPAAEDTIDTMKLNSDRNITSIAAMGSLKIRPKAAAKLASIFQKLTPSVITLFIREIMVFRMNAPPTAITPVIIPTPDCVTPVTCAIAFVTAKSTAIRAMIPITTHVTGEARNAVFKLYCAAVAAAVAVTSAPVAAAWAYEATARAILIPLEASEIALFASCHP